MVSHADQIAKLKKINARNERLLNEARREIEELKARVAEQWSPLNTVAIDLGGEYDTLRSWVHKDLVRWRKRGACHQSGGHSVPQLHRVAGHMRRRKRCCAIWP